MTISKGEAWGAAPDPDLPEPVVVPDDRAVADHAADNDDAVVTPTSGDLLRTLGLDQPRTESLVFPVDLGWARIDDGPPLPFAAHLVARGRGWLGEGAVVMNAAWLGDRYLGPRSHPNDGLLDVTVGRLPVRDLWQARGRARTGTHLPHPDLTVRRVARWTHEFGRPRRFLLDGRPVATGRRIEVWVDPDRFRLVA